MHNVVFDTNVLVAALRSKRSASYLLLSLIGTGAFQHSSVHVPSLDLLRPSLPDPKDEFVPDL
jgi:hypothetical protein